MADDAISGKLVGLEPVIRKLKELGPKVQKKFMARALRKGAVVVQKAAVESARKLDRPETPNKIYEHIVVQGAPRTGKAQGGVAFRVGVEGGAAASYEKSYKNTAENRRMRRVGEKYKVESELFYWRFIEFGTEKVKARPFLTPALESNIGPATDAVAAQLEKDLDKL